MADGCRHDIAEGVVTPTPADGYVQRPHTGGSKVIQPPVSW